MTLSPTMIDLATPNWLLRDPVALLCLVEGESYESIPMSFLCQVRVDLHPRCASMTPLKSAAKDNQRTHLSLPCHSHKILIHVGQQATSCFCVDGSSISGC